MHILHRLRLYHAVLASLSVLAYLSGEWGIVHAWIGYGVAAIIAFRFAWALSGERQVGLSRFYPSFKGLMHSKNFQHPAITRAFMLGIAISLLGVTVTGISMDQGKAIGISNVDVISQAYADDDEGKRRDKSHGVMEEVHEFFANMMLVFVGLHVAYLLAFKRTLAKFMLFFPGQVHTGP
jgi:cytochrome b